MEESCSIHLLKRNKEIHLNFALLTYFMPESSIFYFQCFLVDFHLFLWNKTHLWCEWCLKFFSSHGSSVHPVDIAGCYPSSRAGPPDSSMFLGPHSQQRTPRTPMSYEMMSPASNASSSYLNKNLSSMDNSQSTGSQSAEVSSLIVNIALADSILNIFKDRNFDSCTICVCNMNIDGNDIGLYLPERGSSEDQYRCNCAFSSIINRR